MVYTITFGKRCCFFFVGKPRKWHGGVVGKACVFCWQFSSICRMCTYLFWRCVARPLASNFSTSKGRVKENCVRMVAYMAFHRMRMQLGSTTGFLVTCRESRPCAILVQSPPRSTQSILKTRKRRRPKVVKFESPNASSH